MKTNVVYESRAKGVQWVKRDDGKIQKRLPGKYDWVDSVVTEQTVNLSVMDGLLFEVKP